MVCPTAIRARHRHNDDQFGYGIEVLLPSRDNDWSSS